MSLLAAAAWQFSILGLPARLSQPLAIWLVALAVLASALWLRGILKRRADLARTVPGRLLTRMAPKAGASRDFTSFALSSAGMLLLAAAALQPQCGTRSVVAKRFGMDVVIAIDASNSMLARDVKPSRLERAKLELSSLIDRLKGDRVGIVVFAGDAFVQCPLTNDYAAAKLFLRAVSPADLPQQGTAIGPALRVAGNLMEGGDRGAAGRAVVLLTDGEDHTGDVETETKRLSDQGVRVFTVGIGSTSGEPIPLVDADGRVAGYKKDRQGRTVMTRLAEGVLAEIADKTSGRYVHSASGDLGVGEVYEELERMDKAEFETRMTVQYENRFESFAWPGFVFLLVGLSVGEGRFRRRKEGGA